VVLDPLRNRGVALPVRQDIGVHRLAGHATLPIRPNWNLSLSSSRDFEYSRSRFSCCSMNAIKASSVSRSSASALVMRRSSLAKSILRTCIWSCPPYTPIGQIEVGSRASSGVELVATA
jgi:hypothetical protein